MDMTLLEKALQENSAHSTTNSRMRVARWIGVLTHPVVLAGPVAVASGVHELGWPSLLLMIMGVVTFFASIGFPSLMILILYHRGVIGEDLFLFKRKNRYIVYPILMVGFILDIVLFTWLVPLEVGRAMSWAGLLVVLSLYGMNFVTKISVHCAAIGAIFLGALTIYGKESLIFLPLIPLVIWARVVAHNHTLRQALLGLAVGALAVWFTILVGWPRLNKMTWSNVQGYQQNPPEYWLPFSGRPR